MVEQRFHLTEREHVQLRAISEANEEKHIEIFRRLLRDEYRRLVQEGIIKGPLVIRDVRDTKEKP